MLTPDSSRFWPADQYAAGQGPAELRQTIRARLPRNADLGQDTAGPDVAPRGRRENAGKVFGSLRAADRAKSSDACRSWSKISSNTCATNAGSRRTHAKTYAALLETSSSPGRQQRAHGLELTSNCRISWRFLQHERERTLANQPKDSTARLSSESVYLEIAALAGILSLCRERKVAARERRGESFAAPPLEASAQGADECRNRKATAAGRSGHAANAVRSGDARTGLRLRACAWQSFATCAWNNCISKRGSSM